MVSVDDASASEGIREREWGRFESADIPEQDRDAIERFVKHRRIHGTDRSGTYAPTTETTDLNKLRLSAERAAAPLVSMGMDDVTDLLATLQAPKPDGGYGIGRGIDSYSRALRVFYRWLDRHDDEDAYPFWESIKTGNQNFPEPSERDFPSRDDYDAMMDAARGAPRAQAILAFYWESAVRRTLGAQLRLKDIDFDGQRATFTPNPDGERQKGVEIKPYPLYGGVAILRSYVNNHHPDPENPDAPLFTVKKRFYDARDGEDAALSANRIADILRDLGERAGVECETKPHAFRHAAVGRWKAKGYSLAQVQRRVAWTDRSAAEMWGEYGDPDDDEIDRAIDSLEGVEPAENAAEDGAGRRERRTWDCWNCGLEGVERGACPECGVREDAKEAALNRALVDGDEAALDALASKVAERMDPDEFRRILAANAAAQPPDG